VFFSHSKLETYENCPYKYRLQYIERVRTARKSIEAFTGSLVHESLERLYRDLRMGRCLDEKELEVLYRSRWNETFNTDVFIVRQGYSPDDYREMGLKCLLEYHRRYYPFNQAAPIWLEQRVKVSLPDASGGHVDFSGIVDRLDSLEGGRYEIHDYKTSMTLPDQEKLQADRQLTLYQLAVQQAFPEADRVELVWHYLVFDRERRLLRKPDEVEKVASEAVALAREIESAQDFPERESQLCEWCELQEHCSKRKHIYLAVQHPERELGTEHGIELADRYEEWTAKKREAEERLKELRQEIMDFSVCYGADNLRGSSCTLRISREKLPKIPSKGSIAREDLERLLHERGSWDQVSVLNARRLRVMLDSEKTNGSLYKGVQPLIDWGDSISLRILRH